MELFIRYFIIYQGERHYIRERWFRNKDKLQYRFEGINLCLNGLPNLSQKPLESSQTGEYLRASRHNPHCAQIF